MTQNEQVLAALRRGPLTALQALHAFNCLRLAARVDELRKQGHAISVERKKLPSGKYVAEYRMERA